MSFALRRFKGVRPRTSPRLLPPDEAAYAVNVKLWNGKLRPMRVARQESVSTKTPPIRSIFRYQHGAKAGWLSWSTDVDVVRAPLANDDFGRIFFTGDGLPKLTDSTLALLIEREATANSLATDTTISIDGPNAGFLVGDPLRIDYGGSTQDVTITSVTPSGSSLLIGITPALTNNLNVGQTVTNLANRAPLAAYDLGVPAPASALTTAATSGAGVTTGQILAVEDIILHESTVQQVTTVGDVQSGVSPALDAHLLGTNFSADSDGEPMEFDLRTTIAVRINHSNETRDMSYRVVLNPGASEEMLFDTNNRIARPTGIGPLRTGGNRPFEDWSYEVTCNGVYTPTPGSYNFGARISPIAGIAGDDNDSYTVTIDWFLKVRHTTRINLTLDTGHGLQVGDRITLRLEHTQNTPIDRQLNGRTVEIVAVAGDVVSVAALPGGQYSLDGAIWTQGTDSGEELVSRSYVYTYVATINGQDFESGPSPASAVIDVTDQQPVQLSGFINPTSPLLRATNFTSLRVYRFQPNDSGSGDYLFLVQLAVNASTYQDTIPGTDLGEVIPSDGWTMPPDNLQGLIELPEGGAVGFTDKEICFAVPYQLHSFPIAYRRTTHDRVIALGAFGSSVVAATDGTPYVFTGVDPLTMTMERLEIIQPCMSKQGFVDLGYAVAYPSPEGLMLIATARAEIVTGDWFTADEWARLNPASFVATRYGQRYLCFYDATSVDPLVLERGNDFEHPLKGGFIFDPREGTFVFVDFHATEAWTNPKDDKVYIVQGANIVEFDAGRLELEYRYRSRVYRYPKSTSMACAVVDATTYPVKFTALADGDVKWVQLVRDSFAFRLPDGEHDTWQVEVQSTSQVNGIFVATSMEQLREIMGE